MGVASGQSRRSGPRYHLRRAIGAEYKPGERLPSEQELAQRFGVSRNTIREALEELRASGLLLRKWGLGTFVSPDAGLILAALTELRPLPELIRANGHRCRMEGYRWQRYDGSAPVREWLHVGPNVWVWQLERVYLADDLPAIYIRDWVPSRLGAADIHPEAFKEDMLTFLEEQAGVALDHTITFLEPVLPDDTVQSKLQVASGTPILLTKQVGYSEGGDPVVYTEGYQRTDVLSFHIVRRRRL